MVNEGFQQLGNTPAPSRFIPNDPKTSITLRPDTDTSLYHLFHFFEVGKKS